MSEKGRLDPGHIDGDPWCEDCQSYHPVPKSEEHWKELQCKQPNNWPRPRNMSGGYSGANWLRSDAKKQISEFGARVADILGIVWQGIYHIDEDVLRADFSHPSIVKMTLYGELSTWDFNKLTMLVVLCHDRCIRLQINGCGPMRMQLMFHPRNREGSNPTRHPTMEDHVAMIRKISGDTGE